MDSAMNKVLLLGRLGGDPDLRYTSGGRAVCSMSLATTAYWTTDNGGRYSRTDWHRIIVWGGRAESCKEHLVKGQQVLVEGRLQNHSWEGRDGVKRWSTEVVAHNVLFLARPKEKTEPPAQSLVIPDELSDTGPGYEDTPF